MISYYNEHDPKAAAWLRELIKANLIAPGEVDERSIEDVLPSELAGYTQCHFFAGIGVWSYALRNAGWPDDQPVWTGSCPCQPFSTAGKGEGFADERHLWPAFHWLIRQCQPDVVFGEQVENKNGHAWLDLVQDDLEASGYAVGAVGLCAAGFGAPHIRQRIFFVADAARSEQRRVRQSGESLGWRELPTGRHGAINDMSNTSEQRHDGRRAREASQVAVEPERLCDAGELANTEHGGREARQSEWQGAGSIVPSSLIGELADANGAGRTRQGQAQPEERRSDLVIVGRGATNGFWRNAEWLYCRDEKYRAVEPGTLPLANRSTARVGRLRGYGNAIVAPAAEEFIRAYIQTQEEGER